VLYTNAHICVPFYLAWIGNAKMSCFG